jgi:hypothetical protein
MNSVTANNRENRTLAATALIYCTMMLTVLVLGLYGVYALLQFMFGSLEQTVQMQTWL